MAASKITIQRTRRTVQDHVETCQFHSLLGLKKIVTRVITFDSTAHHVMSPFLTAGTQYHVTNISLDDGFLAVSNMLNDTSPNNAERIIYSNYTSDAFEIFAKSVVDGIFYFLKEDEIINWVVANLTCQQAMQRSGTYACVSENNYCQNVTRGGTHYGYLCKCNHGFQGNPYLPNNCTDIDECSIPNKCNGICHNYDGGFNCTSCSHGKVYDPRKQKCVMSAKEHNLILGIAIGVACGLGSIVVALGAIAFW